MKMIRRTVGAANLMILLLGSAAGCRDDGVAQVAREAADRQAQQNVELAELQKEVAGGTRRR